MRFLQRALFVFVSLSVTGGANARLVFLHNLRTCSLSLVSRYAGIDVRSAVVASLTISDWVTRRWTAGHGAGQSGRRFRSESERSRAQTNAPTRNSKRSHANAPTKPSTPLSFFSKASHSLLSTPTTIHTTNSTRPCSQKEPSSASPS
jgi:hypothetical protein